MKRSLLLIVFFSLIIFSTNCFAQYHIISTQATPTCTGVWVNFYTNVPFHLRSVYSIQIYFGDGKNVIVTDSAVTSVNHSYDLIGNYQIKVVLRDPSKKHIDSSEFTYENKSCTVFSVISYFDYNNNCQYDNGENRLAFPMKVEVDSNSIPIDTISATSGFYYTAYGVVGTVYAFKIISLPGDVIVTCPPSKIIYDTLKTGIIGGTKYFGLQCPTGGSKFDFYGTESVPVTGQRDQWGNFYINNNLSCDAKYATVTAQFSSKYIFKGEATPTPIFVSGNTVTWSLNDLNAMAGIQRIYFVLRNPTSGPVPIGEVIHSTVRITPMTGEYDTTNNTIEVIDTVRGSCDPNEMWVNPAGNILSGTQLQYKINFENVGNDTAHTIYILDTLSDYVNPKTLQIEMASHPMSILKSLNGHTIMRFDFPNINLLDSSHHGECDGMVTFTIKAKEGLPFGTKIFNRAGIYFDDNDVVMTNTVENIIGWPVEVPSISPQGAGLQLWPNPANKSLSLSLSQGEGTYVVTDISGKNLLQGIISSTKQSIDISSLQPGIYFIQLIDKLGQKNNLKFVKE